MNALYQDLRYALRLFWGSPGFTLVAVLTLAVGIAANTAVFSWVDTVLLQPRAGVSDGDDLVTLELIEPNREGFNISYADYRDFRDNLRLSTPAVSFFPNVLDVGERESAERVLGELVSGNYFEVLGVRPLLGRLFSREEQADKPGACPVVVISERLWRSRFLADPNVIGRVIRVNRRPLTIIGVTPSAFCGTLRGMRFDMWAPLMMGLELRIINDTQLTNRRTRMLNGIARLKPGVPIERARTEIEAVARELAMRYPDTNRGFSATLLSEWDTHNLMQARLKAPLLILMAMCFLVLLIACANVANLLLARSAARQREISIRMALGAGRSRLARQLLTEAMLLAALGALAGIPLAAWASQSIAHLVPKMINIPLEFDVRLSGAVMAFTIAITVTATLMAGVSPAVHMIRSDVNESLKEGGRTGTCNRQSHRLRSLFVVSEVALALVTLVGAGLFVSSFRSASAVDPGFDAGDLLVSTFQFSTSGYSPEQRKDFCDRLRARLDSRPGVEAVGYVDVIPLGFGMSGGADLDVEGYLPANGESMLYGRTRVSPGHFDLMRIPLLAGRDFTERDALDESQTIIVSQAFARKFYGGGNPIGRRVRVGGVWTTVVGLVGDTKHYTLDEAPRPYFYAPLRRSSMPPGIAFYLRTSTAPATMMALLRREAAAIDPEIGASQIMLLSDYITGPLFPQRIAAWMLGGLGLVALLLAAVGLYSVMAYAVSERAPEIGVRVALGARPLHILGRVLRTGMGLAVAGILIGGIVAYAGGTVISGMLWGVRAHDPLVFAGAALFLALIALLASSVPALRAARVDPAIALRRE